MIRSEQDPNNCNEKSPILILTLIVLQLSAQQVISKDFDQRLHKLLSFSVPTMDVVDAYAGANGILFLDSRETEEYNTSHIPGARHVGYDDFEIDSMKDVDKNQKIVVYCSVGYRSEKIGEKLKKAGFKNVYNLYGSLFEWANCGYQLHNQHNVATDSIHTYNRKWSKWVTHPDVTKVW